MMANCFPAIAPISHRGLHHLVCDRDLVSSPLEKSHHYFFAVSTARVCRPMGIILRFGSEDATELSLHLFLCFFLLETLVTLSSIHRSVRVSIRARLGCANWRKINSPRALCTSNITTHRSWLSALP